MAANGETSDTPDLQLCLEQAFQALKTADAQRLEDLALTFGTARLHITQDQILRSVPAHARLENLLRLSEANVRFLKRILETTAGREDRKP